MTRGGEHMEICGVRGAAGAAGAGPSRFGQDQANAFGSRVGVPDDRCGTLDEDADRSLRRNVVCEAYSDQFVHLQDTVCYAIVCCHVESEPHPSSHVVDS